MLNSRRNFFSLCLLAVLGTFVYCAAQQPQQGEKIAMGADVTVGAIKRKVDQVEANRRIELSGEVGDFTDNVSLAIGGPVVTVLSEGNSKQFLLSKPFIGTWSELKLELREAGVLTVVDDHGVTYFVQGKKYVPDKFKATACPDTLDFKRLYTAYEGLTLAQRELLLSTEGLTVNPNMSNIPKEMQGIINEFEKQQQKPKEGNRWNLKIQPAASTLFPYVSAPRVAGWWQWDSGRLSELNESGLLSKMGYSNGQEGSPSTAKFPDYIVLSTPLPREDKWRIKKTSLKKGRLSKEEFKANVALSTGFAVQISEEAQWPNIYSSGVDTVLGNLLNVLTMSGGLDVRYLGQTKVLYFAPSTKLTSEIGVPAIDGEDYPKFMNLLSASSKSNQVDFGPLKQRGFAIPTNSLPQKWTGVLLSDLSPEEAWIQVGIKMENIGDDKLPTAINKWLNLYSDTSMLTVPGINLLIQRQTKRIDGIPNEVDIDWFAESESYVVIYPACL